MTMTKQATLSAMVLIGLLTAACTSSSQAGLGSRATASASTAAVATTAASGSASLITPQPEAAPTQGQLLVPPSLAPNRCPPITANPISANPIGCPGPLPPQAIVPQTGHARVLLCTQPVAIPPIAVGTLVCGVGFRPEEVVTVTVSGRTGTTSWQVTTGRDGSFRSMLPPAACRLIPAYLSARGNRGSVSNALPLILASCRRIP
jgi:hypothetical protein